MKPLTAREMERLVRSHGWVENTRDGSHRNFKKPGVEALITIPFHKGKTLPTGLQLAIMKIAGISKEAL